MSTEGLVEMPGGGRAHDHDLGGGGHVRADQAAAYELTSTQDAPTVVDLDQGVLWVSIPPTGGPAVAVRRQGFELVTTDGAVAIEAGPAGDTLVLVADGELDLVDGEGHARRLSRGQAGVLASDGTVSVDEVDDDELAADQWVAANTLLDRGAAPGTERHEAQDSDPPVLGLAEATKALALDPADGEFRPLGRVRPTRMAAVAVLVLVLGLLLALVLTRCDGGDSGAGEGDGVIAAAHDGGARSTTPRSTTQVTAPPPPAPTTQATAPPPPAPTTEPAPVEPVRARLARTAGCVQRGDTLVAAGIAEHARRPASHYRIEVTVRAPGGETFGRAQGTVAVPAKGGPMGWRIEVPVDRNLAGTGAQCEVTSVATLPALDVSD